MAGVGTRVYLPLVQRAGGAAVAAVAGEVAAAQTFNRAPAAFTETTRALRYQPSKTYTYRYDLTVQSQSTSYDGAGSQVNDGLVTDVDVIILAKDAADVFSGQLRMRNVTLCNADRTGRGTLIEDADLLRALGEPLLFKQRSNGVITEVSFPAGAPDAAVNMQKGALNSLQVTLNAAVQEHALIGLLALRKAPQELIEATQRIADTPGEPLRELSLLVLGGMVERIDDPSGRTQAGIKSQLRGGLRSASTEPARILFLDAVGNAGDGDALALIGGYLGASTEFDLREAALQALRKLPAGDAEPRLLAVLTAADEEPLLREVAANVLRGRKLTPAAAAALAAYDAEGALVSAAAPAAGLTFKKTWNKHLGGAKLGVDLPGSISATEKTSPVRSVSLLARQEAVAHAWSFKYNLDVCNPLRPYVFGSITPAASATLEGYAALSVQLLRGGASVAGTLLNTSLPAKATAKRDAVFELCLDITAKTKPLTISVNLFAERRKLNGGWKRFFETTLFKYDTPQQDYPLLVTCLK